MRPLKPVDEQSVVIAGASSGIGRQTALRFAERGARLTLAGRDQQALDELAGRIRERGGQAQAMALDVSEPEAVARLAERAAAGFGGIDTWVNNAGIGVYGTVERVPLDEFQRAMAVDFFGQLHGCRAALPYLRREGRGALICVGSIASDRAMPLLGAYSAAKHAVKALTEALRVELQAEGSAIQVTLIKPASINTPFFEHAASHLGVKPRPLPPVYDADLVARAIVRAAEQRAREITVGGAGKAFCIGEACSGPLLDRVLRWYGFRGQRTDEPAPADLPGTLYQPPRGDIRVAGPFASRGFSVYGWTRRHPAATAAALTAAGALSGLLARNGRSQRPS